MSGLTDPIADMLTRIRNGGMARHEVVLVPTSNVKLAIARLLKTEGFIRDAEVVRGQAHRVLKLTLRYPDGKSSIIQGVERLSRPGKRVYVRRDQIPRVRGGIGICVLSTPRGLLTGQEARQMGIGGELLFQVW